MTDMEIYCRDNRQNSGLDFSENYCVKDSPEIEAKFLLGFAYALLFRDKLREKTCLLIQAKFLLSSAHLSALGIGLGINLADSLLLE